MVHYSRWSWKLHTNIEHEIESQQQRTDFSVNSSYMYVLSSTWLYCLLDYNEPFSGSKPLPDLFTIKYYWELSNEVYEDQSYLYFVWITIILVLTYVLLFFIVKPVHQYDDSSNTIQSPSEFNKSNASFGSMNSLGGKKGSFSGPLSTSGSTGMTSAVYRNNRLKAD